MQKPHSFDDYPDKDMEEWARIHFEGVFLDYLEDKLSGLVLRIELEDLWYRGKTHS